jgi:hypothetical protein
MKWQLWRWFELSPQVLAEARSGLSNHLIVMGPLHFTYCRRRRHQRDRSQLTYRGHILSRRAHALREAKQRFGERDVLVRSTRDRRIQ